MKKKLGIVCFITFFLYFCLLPRRHAVVVGQSISGMMASAILAKSGYYVDVYEMRSQYTRNIQWAARQSLIDEIASIDKNLSKRFVEDVSSPLVRGSIHFDLTGIRREKSREGLRPGDPLLIPRDGLEMISFPSVINMEAKVFEAFLKEYVQSLPYVRWHQCKAMIEKRDDKYAILGQKTPDLIIIAEGANSATRSYLGIPMISTTEARTQLAGAIGFESGGVMIKHWRQEGRKTMLTGAIGKLGSKMTWIVGDVDPMKLTNQKQIDQEFKQLAAFCLELPLEQIESYPIYGSAEGVPIQPFFLQQKLSEKVTAGENLIFIGDAVGTGHWSVGGGMQIGAVCHIERLKTLLRDFDLGMSRTEVLKKYSEGVLFDTRCWEEAGVKDFYLTSCVISDSH